MPFTRLTLAELFKSTNPFGVSISQSLIFNKNWLCLELRWPDDFQSDIKHPNNTPEKLDVFKHFSDEEIQKLRSSSNTFFMLSILWEGLSYQFYNFYKLLTLSAQKHNIPSHKIFFVTSNLLEEETYNTWQLQYSPDYCINVISFDFFSGFTSRFIDTAFTIDDTVTNIRNNPKFFLSLNRRKKHERVYTIYQIFKSNFKDNTLISYDKLTPQDNPTKEILFNNLCASSPSILDFSDFSINWATGPKTAAAPVGLYKNSMVSLVGESLYDSFGNTSLFYSEKTFKPMLYNHPLIIFGQGSANSALTKIGFKTYDKYFDLNFENESNAKARINLQVDQIEKLNSRLLSMSTDQKIEWVLQDRETLEHNKQMLIDQPYNRIKLDKLVQLVG